VNKTPEPGEVVRDKVIPAAEELVASLAERVGPLAREAVDQVSPMALAAAEKTVAWAHVAAEMVGPLTLQAVEAVTPLAQQTRDAVAPYAQQAADAVGPYAQQVGPRAQQAAGAALDAAKDAFAGARDKVSTDYLPAVGAAAASAAASASPLLSAATERGKALVQTSKNEPVVVPPPAKKRGWFTTLAVVAAAAGATYVVVRRLAGDKGSQWQTARPTTPYASPVSAEAGVAEPTPEPEHAAGETEVVASTTSLYGTVGSADGAAPTVDTDESAIAARNETVDGVADADEALDAPSVPTGTSAGSDGSGGSTSGGSGSSPDSSGGTFGGAGASTPFTDKNVEKEVAAAEERIYEEPESAVWAEDDAAMGGGPDAHPERYDIPGAYVGVEPPEGFTIEGNERSMRYHMPDSNSYGRTIAQVWFSSEEAAQQAGFTRSES
jgi:hypothetical protein